MKTSISFALTSLIALSACGQGPKSLEQQVRGKDPVKSKTLITEHKVLATSIKTGAEQTEKYLPPWGSCR